MRRIAVVGGCGFVGRHLAVALARKGCYSILILDISQLPLSLYSFSNVLFQKLDLNDIDSITRILRGFRPDLIIDIAGWGMSGIEMLSEKCIEVNVDGTQNLIDCCLENNICKFIFTSTCNVNFCGGEIQNGEETLPYAGDNKHLDRYSYSKAIAEKLVLKANGQRTADGSRFISSCIRPTAIYGEGEMRHLPRIISHIDNGMFLLRIGQAIVDWVHVDNLVLSYVLLAEKMLGNTTEVETVAGQAYFISDGSPIDNFKFFKPLCLARDQPFPENWIIPTFFILWISYFMELLFYVSSSIGYPIYPLLIRAEVVKVGVTHNFSIKKAREHLGYSPILSSIEGSERLAKFYANRDRDNYFQFVSIFFIVPVVFFMYLLYEVAFLQEPFVWDEVGALDIIKWLAFAIFRTKFILQVVFWLAIFAHIFEGFAALSIASTLKLRSKYMWFLQTLLTGFFSLRVLLSYRDKHGSCK